MDTSLYYVLRGDTADGKTVTDETFRERDSYGLRTFSELRDNNFAIDSGCESDREEIPTSELSQRLYVDSDDDNDEVMKAVRRERYQNGDIIRTIKRIAEQLRYRAQTFGSIQSLCEDYTKAAETSSAAVPAMLEFSRDNVADDETFRQFRLGLTGEQCLCRIRSLGHSDESYRMLPEVWSVIASYLTPFFYDAYYPIAHFRGNFHDSVLSHAVVLATRPRGTGEMDSWETEASKTEIRRGRYSRVTKNGTFVSRDKQVKFKLDYVSSGGIGTNVWMQNGKPVGADADDRLDSARVDDERMTMEFYEKRYPDAKKSAWEAFGEDDSDELLEDIFYRHVDQLKQKLSLASQ